MIDLKGLNGVEIDRVKKAYAQGVVNGFQQGRNDIKPLIDEIHDNVYQEGGKTAIRKVFARIEQPNNCLFDSINACCYPISDCMNCPITIDEMKI